MDDKRCQREVSGACAGRYDSNREFCKLETIRTERGRTASMKKFGRFVCLMLVFTLMMGCFAMPAMASVKYVNKTCPKCNQVRKTQEFCSGVSSRTQTNYASHTYSEGGSVSTCYKSLVWYKNRYRCTLCSDLWTSSEHKHYILHSMHSKERICTYGGK